VAETMQVRRSDAVPEFARGNWSAHDEPGIGLRRRQGRRMFMLRWGRFGTNEGPIRIRTIADTHCVPHLLADRTHAGVDSHAGRAPGQKSRSGTPLVRASALHDVSRCDREATWDRPLIREYLS
jgi:hypothetical protein